MSGGWPSGWPPLFYVQEGKSMTIEAMIVLVIFVAIVVVGAVAIYRGRLNKEFKPEEFVEVERPEAPEPTAPLRPDSPVAPVFQISEDPLERLESWAATTARSRTENYYMSIMPEYGKSWTHPFIPEMKPTQWVRIVAPSDGEARKIAHHYSGGYYATLHSQAHFLMVKEEFFPGGEYDCLSHETYWLFQDTPTI